MKCRFIFPEKIKYINMLSAAVVNGDLRVK